MVSIKKEMNIEDFAQMVIGSTILTVPIAFTQEAWMLSKTLPWVNVAGIIFISLGFICLYAYIGIFDGKVHNRLNAYLGRIIIDYSVACLTVAVLLLVLNKLPILEDWILSIRRVIVLTLPASMGAVVMDGFDKE